MSSPEAGAARINRPAMHNSTRRVIAAERSSGAGGSPALFLGRRLDDGLLDVKAAALEVLARRLVDCRHLVLRGLLLSVDRGELDPHACRCFVVACIDRRAELPQGAVTAC